ncbi:MAG: penicillin-binding protein 1C [Cyanobacteria bacterium P01_G01_bin.4]
MATDTMGFPQRKLVVVTLSLLGLATVIRLVPYLAPIDVSKQAQDDRSLTFRDRNDLVLGTLLTQTSDRTATVELDDISPHFIAAILAAEDADFYDRGPLDIPALARATYQWARHGQIVSGGSTVTMQLARMMHPAPRTIPNKLREIWRSWRIAAGSSKDDILQAYINRLPMGGNIYGVEAASRIYFGLPASDLTLSQASLLAAIPNNPNHLNPYQNLEHLQRRQTYVVDRMVAEDLISQSQANRAFAETISLQQPQHGIVAAPHFLFWVASLRAQDAETEIRTTLDRPLQTFVEAQVQQVVRSLADRNVHQASAIVIDNATGDVLAYVGSPNYFSGQAAAQFDGVQALRQPGSTLKPFLYEQAIASRLLAPNAVLPDIPTYYPLGNAQIYRPVDFDRTFQGPVRVRLALANSLNIPAVKVLETVGTANFLNHLQELGFSHLEQSSDHYGLGLALGAGEVSLWELASAYATMARLGEVTGLRSLTDEMLPTSTPASTSAPTPSVIGDPEVWALVANMLSDRHARASAFGIDSALSLPFPAAVKTGTSSGFRDTWTVGFTADYTVATWVGNFDGSRMEAISGVDGAAPLWQRILLHLHEQQEPQPFPRPHHMELVPVCALSGLKPTDACPAVANEYIFPDQLDTYEQQVDTVYRRAGDRVQLDLPSEYDEWLATYGQALQPSSSIRIVSPRNGDRFVLYPDTPLTPNGSQQIEFRLSQTAPSSVWTLNNRPLAAPNGHARFWSLQPGTWTLEVTQGDSSDRVTFVVEPKQNTSHPPEFTLDARHSSTSAGNCCSPP